MVTLKFKSWENGDKQRIHSSWFTPYNKAKCQAKSVTIAHQVSKVTDNPALKLKMCQSTATQTRAHAHTNEIDSRIR